MISKIQFKIEILSLYLRKNLVYFLAGLVLGSLIFIYRQQLIALSRLPVFRPKKIGIEGLYTADSLPSAITDLISYGLTANSDTNKNTPSPLVKSLDIQNNNRDYVFYLNDNIYWHNGRKFTAYDIDYQISGLNFTVINPYQLKISSENTFAPLLSLLSKPLLKNTVGLGPYRIKNIDYQDGYVHQIWLQSLNKTDDLIYRFYPNDELLIAAFKVGAVDQISLSNLPADMLQWANTKVTQTVDTNHQYSAVFFNTEKFSSKQIRQALAYATPKTKDRNERCLGPVSPNSWAYNPSVKEYSYSPTKAKKIWDSEKDAQPKSINLSVNNRDLLATAENIKTAWKEILNIEVIITIENRIDTQNFDAVLAYGGIPSDPDQYPFWHSLQGKTNLTKIKYPPIDKLLEDGRQTLDPLERKKIYQNFQRILLEECPAVFLTYPTIYTVNRLK